MGLLLFLLAFVAAGVLLGAVTKAWTHSVTAGLVAGIFAALAGGAHMFQAFVRAVGEYEGPPSAYERFADEHFWPLLIGYMTAPALLICLLAAAWQRAAIDQRRSSS